MQIPASQTQHRQTKKKRYLCKGPQPDLFIFVVFFLVLSGSLDQHLLLFCIFEVLPRTLDLSLTVRYSCA